MKKVILDTDIGSDIDDALCLAYLLNQPECELLGITTVSGEAGKRAMLASAICKHAEKEVPIYVGIDNPLIIQPVQSRAQQAERLCNWAHDKTFPDCHAVEFMRRTIRENPGEISLLAIGPLTNIAVLFTIDPEIPSLLKELVLMCGRFVQQPPVCDVREWNALCDPHSTAIVYQAGVKNFYSIGLDVTRRVVIKKDEIKQELDAEILKPVRDFAEIWFEGCDNITFHDPLAAAVMFDEGICSFVKGTVSTELQSERLQGFTYFEQTENGRHQVAVSVDADRFFQHYFKIVAGAER